MNRLLLTLIATAALWAQAPDTILVNGKILTADANFTVQQAIAVQIGRAHV